VKPRIARLLMMVFLFASVAVGQQPKLDGAWWRTLSSEERVEFLAGYIDCYANDFGDKNNTFPESWYTYAPRITQYYDQNPPKLTRQVSSVLFGVRSKLPPKPQKGGETWTEKHWFFNGDYWRGLGNAEREAFIEGYLPCHLEHLSSRPERFTQSSTNYVEKISHWFGVNPTEPSEVNAKRAKVAIADALYRFADAHLKK
jgi:hypothetical protein